MNDALGSTPGTKELLKLLFYQAIPRLALYPRKLKVRTQKYLHTKDVHSNYLADQRWASASVC